MTGGLQVNWWLSGDGSLSPTNGDSTTLLASMSPSSPTVHAKIQSAELSLQFDVVAPSGVGNVSVNSNIGFGTPDANGAQIGAITKFNVQVFPTNVNFHNVTFREN